MSFLLTFQLYLHIINNTFVVSGDTDYRPVYEQLKNMGKLVVLVFVKGQKISSLRNEVDNFIMLDKDFFSQNIRASK